MDLTVSTRQVGSVTILDLRGRIVMGPSSSAVRDSILNLVNTGRKQILLNLRDVDYLDSRGLGDLVGALTSVRKQGGDLKLLHVNDRVTNLMEITRLYMVFDTAVDETEALRSFAAPESAPTQ